MIVSFSGYTRCSLSDASTTASTSTGPDDSELVELGSINEHGEAEIADDDFNVSTPTICML